MKNLGIWQLFKIITLLFIPFLLIGNLSCERQNRPESMTKINSSPIITSVRIFPEKPYQDSELNLIIQSQDPDGDPVMYRYQWIKNGEEIIGENRGEFKSGNFKKGDFIQVRVTPSDGKTEGDPYLTNQVKILNVPPAIQGVWIKPEVAYANDRLSALVKAIDKDGDLIYFTYQWEKNGAVLPEEKKEILESGKFKKGDSITVTVTPNDGENIGMSHISDPIIISNSPPAIVASPPISIKGTVYLYQVKANDPDHDPIIFSLKSGPKGMEIDKNTGLIRWEIRKEDKGTHSIEIEASDNEGSKTIQKYTLIVDFKSS
jgi:hypothetical protein